MEQDPQRLLWLQPSTGDNISIRRDRIAEHLEARGYETTIVNVTGTDIFSALLEAFRGDYDVIFGNVRIGLYVGYPLARLLGASFVGDVSDPIEQIADLPAPLYRILYWYEHWVLSHADASVFTYRSSLKEADARGIDGRLLPNAVEFDAFSEPEPAILERARTNLEDSGVSFEKPIAIYAGILADHYHIPEILAAARDVDEWEFVFLGEGDLEDDVQRADREFDTVHFLGSVPYDDVPGYLAHATAGFCLVDRRQTLKIVEYGAAGLAAIVEHGALTDRFPEAVVGIEATTEAVVDALEKLAANTEQCREYGERLHERTSKYDWAEIADGYEEIIQDIT